jgi:hypothetical protein
MIEDKGDDDMMAGNVMETAEAVLAAVGMLLAWKAGEIKKEDKEIIEAHEFVMDSLSDADLMARTELATGKDLREQMSVGDAMDLVVEVGMLRMGNSRN